MTYLVASSRQDDLQAVRESSPETWRQVRRYNLPVQLALAAANEVIAFSKDAASAALISLAPCQPGSAELYSWGHVVTAGMTNGSLGNLRMNPTQTLHAVDNLALSAFAIACRNRSYCLGLGGAAGQAWCALEAVEERLASGREEEAVLIAGDQDSAREDAKGLGIALLFSTRPRHYENTGQLVRLVDLQRGSRRQNGTVAPHAAQGLSSLLSAIEERRQGTLTYTVPPEHTDGFSSITISLEIRDA